MDILFAVLAMLENGSESQITKQWVGKYCINEDFFIDARKQLMKEGVFTAKDLKWTDCTKETVCRKIILAYWRRYCKRALKEMNIKTLCAVFRKGSKGRYSKTAVNYARRANNLYKELRK